MELRVNQRNRLTYMGGGFMKDYLKIRNITKKFGKFTALNNINIDIEKGEFVCLLGPSGCGKTTILRIIAGLEEPDSGSIDLDRKDITGLSPAKRNFGIVFQSYALFPNLTAYQNVAYGLRNRKIKKSELDVKVNEVLKLVELEAIRNKYPYQMSGGQQQRVALARALALSPEILLLDEPLSALDAKVRSSLRREIRKLQEKLGITTIMVTHDQEEALTMADKVVVMQNALVMQIGTPQEVYEKPLNYFVANFIGEINFLESNNNIITDGDDLIAVRPEDIQFIDIEDDNSIKTNIVDLEFRGSFYRLTLGTLNKERYLRFDVPSNQVKKHKLKKNMVINIEIPQERLIRLKSEAKA